MHICEGGINALLNDLKYINFSISADMDQEGNLLPVGKINAKIESLKIDEIRDYTYLVVATNQADKDRIDPRYQNHKLFRIIYARDFDEMIIELHQNSSLRKALLEKTKEEFCRIEIPSTEPEEIGRDIIYQANTLLIPIYRTKKPDSVIGIDPIIVECEKIDKRVLDSFEEKPVFFKRISLDELFTSNENCAPRITLFGDTGSGKTEYLHSIAYLTSQGLIKYKKKSLAPVLINCEEFCEWISKSPDEDQKDLASYLANQHQQLGISKTTWLSWLEYGDIVLLFDNTELILDNSRCISILKITFDKFKNCPLFLTCSIDDMKLSSNTFWGFRKIIVNNLEEEQQIQFIKNFFEISINEAYQIYNRFLSFSQVKRFLSKPKYLSLLCVTVKLLCSPLDTIQEQQVQKKVFEAFIDRIINLFIIGFPKENHNQTWRDLFRRLSYDIQMLTIENGSPPTEDNLKKLFSNYTDEFPQFRELLSSREITKHLCKGLLRKNRNGPIANYEIALPDMGAFLAAEYLSIEINNDRKNELSTLDISKFDDNKISFYPLIDLLAWKTDFNDTLVLLSGMLDDPYPLIAHLEDPRYDDVFMHRRALAMRCLLIDSDKIPNGKFGDLIGALVNSLKEFWDSSEEVITENYFKLAIQGLIQFEKNYVGYNHGLESEFAEQLEKPPLNLVSKNKRTQILLWLEGQSIPNTIKVTIERMLNKLADGEIQNESADPLAFQYIAEAGYGIVTDASLTYLAQLIKNPEYRNDAIEAVRRIGIAAVTDDVINAFADLINSLDPNENELRLIVLSAIRDLKIAQHERILPKIMAVLTDKAQTTPEIYLCQYFAALAETDLGSEKVPIDDILPGLFSLTSSDFEKQIQENAKRAITRAIQNTSDPKIKQYILKCYNNFKEIRNIVNKYQHNDQTQNGFISPPKINNIDVNLLYERIIGRIPVDKNDLKLIKEAELSTSLCNKLIDEIENTEIDIKIHVFDTIADFSIDAASRQVLKTMKDLLQRDDIDSELAISIINALGKMENAIMDEEKLLDIYLEKTDSLKKNKQFRDEIKYSYLQIIIASIKKQYEFEKINRLIIPLIQILDLDNNIQYSEEIKALHEHGIRFFQDKENNKIIAYPIEELCNKTEELQHNKENVVENSLSSVIN